MTGDPRATPNSGAYLDRIGVAPDSVEGTDRRTLERLQRAQIRSVPFENLDAVGDLFGASVDPGVELSVPAIYGKVVEDERGGHCYELNGLFQWLLRDLGYDARLVAARMTDEEDDPIHPPANHAAVVVDLDRRYLLDVGQTQPFLRQPVPFDGDGTDCAGTTWRVRESDRPDETHRVEYRLPGETWTTLYVFTDEPRELSYFRAANDYFATDPDSPFGENPWIAVATAGGYRKLSGETLTVVNDGVERERSIPEPDEWYRTLERAFGLSYDRR
jgi:N-hydroxyarylamine O-acetyltransferase